MKPDFSKQDLIPAVIQDSTTRRVLMLGYMNDAAFKATVESGFVTFYSRSKERLWKKGETSGHTLAVKNILLDCDRDTILIEAIPNGPTCHTGSDTCFEQTNSADINVLSELSSVIRERKANPKEGSYTNSLFQKGLQRIAQKVGEEAVELVIASQSDVRERVVSEAADLLFHLLVLLESKDISLSDVTAELKSRSR